MLIARLAWRKMSPAAREFATKTLAAHPHYAEFLAADRPAEIAAEEWAFLRAAVWPDWVRDHHSATYYKPEWHFVNVPFVPPQSHVDPRSLKTPDPNITTQIPVAIDKVKQASAEERAIYLSWLLHLVGDIHQPLHCTMLVSERFPRGDRGGNLALIRRAADQPPTNLHLLWDTVLGETISPAALDRSVAECQDLEKQCGDSLARSTKEHTSPISWAAESFETAKESAYLNGELHVANADLRPDNNDVPLLPEVYAKNCTRVGGLCAIKAGIRLAEAVGRLQN
jgi:S1/P1 nuclease